MKLFVICGHGAGDPGACAHGHTEAERVRALAARMEALGGGEVAVGDTSRNWYADNGIGRGHCPSGVPVVELHMDSAAASARGGHVIICSQFEPDAYDEALAAHCKSMFPGRSVVISKRSDLANPNRAAAMGVNYRLLENCFISNADDLAKFNANIDEVAKGILACFGIGDGAGATAEPEAPAGGGKTVAQLADEVMAGAWGNGGDRRSALQAAGYDYDAVQAEVNRRCGVGSGGGSDIDDLARRAIAGEFGNGEQRRTALGADYDAVQARVNEMLGFGGGSRPVGSIGVGSSVVVANPVDENGTRLSVSGTYTVMEVSGSRVVIGRGGAVTAALPVGNLRLT